MSFVRSLMIGVSLLAIGVSTARAAENGRAGVVVDFARPAGKIRALHGVNGGPVAWGYVEDLTKYHADAGFPSTRLHDTHWPCADVVDIPVIFPLFHADADDPKNYLFAKTDIYLDGIVKNGSRITYRLGTTIENRLRNISGGGINNHPPKDYEKWAKICVNVIRHLNDGWANGHHFNIQYFEIWNEPEGAGTWTGTIEEYCKLYEVAVKALKAYNPSLKVGGPVMGGPIPFSAEPFLVYCRDHKLPLDFFSWHYYSDSPQAIVNAAVNSRAMLDKYGFQNAESHLTEWHYIAPPGLPDLGPVDRAGNPNREKIDGIRNYFAQMRGPGGAAFCATLLMVLQDAGLDMANFYSADVNPWSMFDEWGVPGKVYFTFLAFNELVKTPNRVACEKQGEADKDVTICAGVSEDGKTASLLISNYGLVPHPFQLSVDLKNLPLSEPMQAETFAIDATHEFVSLGKTGLQGNDATLTLDMPGPSVYLVRLGAAPAKQETP